MSDDIKGPHVRRKRARVKAKGNFTLAAYILIRFIGDVQKFVAILTGSQRYLYQPHQKRSRHPFGRWRDKTGKRIPHVMPAPGRRILERHSARYHGNYYYSIDVDKR